MSSAAAVFRRVAALYDIHGNLDALNAVLDEVHAGGVDLVVCGGDVFPGPHAVECLERLLAFDVPVRFIHGNGDRELLAERRGGCSPTLPEPVKKIMAWSAARLTDVQEGELARWPSQLSVIGAGVGEVMFCHATARNDVEIFTRESSDEIVAPMFAGVSADIVVCGHTHMQFDRKVGAQRVVNAGSVGMPFGSPGAYWLMLDGGVQFRCAHYDFDAAATHITESDFPGAAQFAQQSVLHPPTEEAMLAFYAAR